MIIDADTTKPETLTEHEKEMLAKNPYLGQRPTYVYDINSEDEIERERSERERGLISLMSHKMPRFRIEFIPLNKKKED